MHAVRARAARPNVDIIGGGWCVRAPYVRSIDPMEGSIIFNGPRRYAKDTPPWTFGTRMRKISLLAEPRAPGGTCCLRTSLARGCARCGAVALLY